MKKIIVNTDLKSESYHHCDRHDVVLNGILETSIVIKFISTNRTDTKYSIEYISPTRNFINSKDVKYGAMNNMYKDVIRDIEEIFSYNEIELTKDEINKIGDIICKCVSKCESRFGMEVKDFDTYQADAVLSIKGEDDGKPKYLVKIINAGPVEDVEDGVVTDLIDGIHGDVYYDVEHDMYIWKIPTSELSFQSLVAKIIEEFDNPYLIITPNLEIILDFKMNTEVYEKLNSKHDRSVEQVKELYNILIREVPKTQLVYIS